MQTTHQTRSLIVVLTGMIAVAPAAPQAVAGREVRSPEPAKADIVPEMIGDLPGSAFKIAENESPRPQDRIYFTYNYYNKVSTGDPIGGFPGGTVPLVLGGGRDFFDVHREVIGFEKTFLDGQFSVGIRVPIFTISGGNQGVATRTVQTGTQTVDDGKKLVTVPVFTTLTIPGGGGPRSGTELGDISLIAKYALLNTPDTVVSAGLVLTLPTSTEDRAISDVKFQPFIAGLWSNGPTFVQGFASVVVPTDSRDVALSFTDIGVGYRMFSSPFGCLQQVTPMAEVHINVPLTHTDTQHTSVDLTGGLNLQFSRGMALTLGAGAPVTGPRPFNVEAIAQFNLRF